MKQLVAEFQNFKWFDVIAPQVEDLTSLAEEFQIPLALLKDCLDPVKLPKLEKIMGIQFYLFRVFDTKSDPHAETIPSLTRKIAVFIGPDFILTVHRLPQPEISGFSQKCLQNLIELGDHTITPTIILAQLFEQGLRTYFAPLERIEDEIETFEGELFSKSFEIESFQNLHRHRRQLSLIKRLALHSRDLVLQMTTTTEFDRIVLGDLKETLHHLIFFSDELMEDTTNLLSLQISLASQKTNEVMRVLTLFSVFFMPLTFIVGVYGMNFHKMPELDWEFGYLGVWIIMAAVSAAIGWWFRRKGWLVAN